MVSRSRTLDFTALHCAREVARAGGISAAAARLRLSKSAVSKHLARLEALLGVTLFERTTRRVLPTGAAQRLLPQVESLVAEAELMVERAGEERAELAGLVRLTSTPEFGALAMRALGPALRARHPAVRLALTARYTFDDLLDPTFDLALRIGQVHDDRLVARRLGALARVPVASPAFLAGRPVRRVPDLGHVPCLLFSGSRTEGTWWLERVRETTGRAARAARAPRAAAEVPGEGREVPVSGPLAAESFAALRQLVLDGHGVSLLPEFLVDDDLRSGALVRVLPAWRSVPVPVLLVHRVGAERVRRVRAVIEVALESLPPLLEPPVRRNAPPSGRASPAPVRARARAPRPGTARAARSVRPPRPR